MQFCEFLERLRALNIENGEGEFAALESCFSVSTSIFLIITCIYSDLSFVFLPYFHQKHFFEIRARGGQEEFPPFTAIFLCICFFILHIYSYLYFFFSFASFFPYFVQKIYPKRARGGGEITHIKPLLKIKIKFYTKDKAT